MLQDAHSRKISLPITAPVGSNIIITSVPGTWLYVHELMGDLSLDGTVDVYAGARLLATYNLDAGQGLTVSDEPGEDNRPRFECMPGEDFILVITGGTFIGACHYSFRE